jgi:hypothetical protein
MAEDIKKPTRQPDGELLRLMIHLSNNSQMTNEAAVRLTGVLQKQDLDTIKRWMQHAQREVDFKIQQGKASAWHKRGLR